MMNRSGCNCRLTFCFCEPFAVTANQKDRYITELLDGELNWIAKLNMLAISFSDMDLILLSITNKLKYYLKPVTWIQWQLQPLSWWLRIYDRYQIFWICIIDGNLFYYHILLSFLYMNREYWINTTIV